MTDDGRVLVVGAGPTGLTLAAQLAAHGVQARLIDRSPDRVHESRALAIQPRTLEVLAGFGVTEQLVARGNTAVRLHLHVGDRVRTLPMFDLGLADTAYPYLLFLSQAETERILHQHVLSAGVTVDRDVELLDLSAASDGVTCRLRHADGRPEAVRVDYVVGCDGAHSTVRRAAGIPFAGSAYPQTFVLADLEADGLEREAAHAFLSQAGMLFFFPLGQPASWRLLVMRPPTDPTPVDRPVTVEEVQALADAYTGRTVRLHHPVWMTNFQLHHRAAERYRAGRILLAGDAAHIHSPAGAQGMNTGIQDAINLGWKLAHAIRDAGSAALLDTYEPERAPIGRMVLRLSDRAFTIATSTNSLARLARTRIAPAVIRLAARASTARAYAFRTVSELGIHYRTSALSTTGPKPPRRGPKAGDRLPDALTIHNGQETTLHRLTATPCWHLLICGRPLDAMPVELFRDHRDGLVAVHHVNPADPAARRLGVGPRHSALYLIRPDGHVGYRSGPTGWPSLIAYLDRWLPASGDTGPR